MKFEAKIILFLQSNATAGWLNFFMFATSFASVVGLIFFAGIIFMRDKKLSLFYALTFGFTSLFNLLVKFIFCRPRPFESYPDIKNFGQENGYSMPSSHSALAAMTAVFICYFAFKQSKSVAIRTLTVCVMTLFVALIALSRMVLGVHYLTDTLAGIAEGVALGFAGIGVYKAAKNPQKSEA